MKQTRTFILISIFLTVTACSKNQRISEEQKKEMVLEFASLLEKESMKFKHKSAISDQSSPQAQ